MLGVAALALVGVEWYLLGAISGVDWPRAWWLPRAALWVLVGSALTALAQLALALVGVGFYAVPLTLLVAAVMAVALRAATVSLARLRAVGLRGALQSRDTSRERLEIDRAERGAWAALGLLLVAATLRSLIVPEAGWDAYSHWGLRAQAYAVAGAITNAGSEHEYYPPLVPLLEAWLYLHRGAVLIDLGKTIWALVGSAFAICLAWHLRLVLRPAWLGPLAATAIVLTTAELIDGFWTGQADLALTAWLTLATLAVWQSLGSAPGRRRAAEFGPQPAIADAEGSAARQMWLIQASVFSAAAAFSKLEGLPRIAVLAAAVLVCARAAGLKPALAVLLPAVVAGLLWTVTAARAGISPNAEHLGALQLTAIPSVALALVQTFGGLRTGGALLVVAAAWLVAYRHLPLVLVVVTLGQLALTLLAFLLSAVSPEVEVRTSATRLFEHLLPVALVAAAVGLRKTQSHL